MSKVFIDVLVPGADPALEQHIIVYNPLAWNITAVINVTVALPNAAVYDDDGQPVPAQVGAFFIPPAVI